MMKISDNRKNHNYKAQSLVEFALVLPLVVLLLVGIFDIGRAFFASITITNAARSGARYYVIYHTTDTNTTQNTCNTTIAEASTSNLTIDYPNVTISCGSSVTCSSATPPISCPTNESITVSIDYVYDDMIFKFFFPTGINMHRSIEMYIP